MERYTLDRRRVEAGHFQFAVLQVASWYPDVFSTRRLPLHASLDETLADVVSVYRGAFMARNAGREICKKSLCFFNGISLHTCALRSPMFSQWMWIDPSLGW